MKIFIQKNGEKNMISTLTPTSCKQRKTELELKNDLSKMGICSPLTQAEKDELIEIYKSEKVEE